MTKREQLAAITFGQRVAEEEVDELASYFVETDQWLRIWSGEVDVVYGPKGSGKSAIYFLLSSRSGELLRRGIVLIAAENPRGAPAFSDLVEDPPTSEAEFRNLWKVYFLTLVGEHLQAHNFESAHARTVIDALEGARLLQQRSSLQRKIRAALDYVRSILQPQSVEGSIVLDPTTGLPRGVTGKISLREPSPEESSAGVTSVDQLFAAADDAFQEAGLKTWIVLDRLDVAFAERRELEENALRALFRVYVDLRGLDSVALKIFLRDDIWARITSGGGFREASHITRTETITWNDQSLMHLIVRRAVQNESIQGYYDVLPERVLSSMTSQEELFFRVFPQQIDPGSRRPDTFKWILSRTRDATASTMPRELIHLLEASRKEQLRLLERGGDEPPGETLIGPAAIKSGLPEVSKARLELTLYAEYPEHRRPIQQLEGGKTEHKIPTLQVAWDLLEDQARQEAQALVDLGFFEMRGARSDPSYWIPFLYRDALNLIQGTADL